MSLVNLVLAELAKPWERGAAGPDKWDCWNIAAHIAREEFGRAMPDIREPPSEPRELIRFVKNHPARRLWAPADGPAHGRLVEIAQVKHPYHIGMYLDLDGGGVLHCAEGIGVSFDPLHVLKFSWSGFYYHEWVGPN